MAYYRPDVYLREDNLYEWRLYAPNGQIVATSGGQGYTEKNDAQEAIEKIISIIQSEREE